MNQNRNNENRGESGYNYGFGSDYSFPGGGYEFTATTSRQLGRRGGLGTEAQHNRGGSTGNYNTGGRGDSQDVVNRTYQRVMRRDYGQESLVCELIQPNARKARVLKDTQRNLINQERKRMKSHYRDHIVKVPKEICLGDPHLVEILAVPRSQIDMNDENENDETEQRPQETSTTRIFDEEEESEDEDQPRTLHSRNTGGLRVTRLLNMKTEQTYDIIYDTDSLVYPNQQSDHPIFTEESPEEDRIGTLNDGVFENDAFRERYNDFPYLSLFELFFGSVDRDVQQQREQEERNQLRRRQQQQSRQLEDEDEEEEEDDEEESNNIPKKAPGDELLDHFWVETNLHAHFKVIYKKELQNIARFHTHLRIKNRITGLEKKNEALENYFKEVEDEEMEDIASPDNNPDLDPSVLDDGENEDFNEDDRIEEEEEEEEEDFRNKRVVDEDDEEEEESSEEEEQEQEQQQQQEIEEEEEEEEENNKSKLLLEDWEEEAFGELAKTIKFRKWANDWKKDNRRTHFPYEYFTKETIQRYIISVMLMGLQRGDDSVDRIWTSILPTDLLFALMARDEFNLITSNFHYSYCFLRDWMEKHMPKFYTPGCYLSVDESICAYYGRAKKVKIRGKPKSQGIKSMSLNDSNGYCMKFVVYHGKITKDDDEYQLAKKDFDHSGEGVIRRLVQNTVTNRKEEFIGEGHILLADRWFGIMDAVDTLATMKIPCVLTMNKQSARGRDAYVALETETSQTQGIHLACAPVSNQDYLLTSWHDSVLVRFLSYRVKDTLVDKVSRYGLLKKQPLAAALYNGGMGGTDTMNRYLYRFQNGRRFRRKSMKILYFFLAMLNTNLFIIHKTKEEEEDRDSLYWFLFNLGNEYVKHFCEQDDHTPSYCVRLHEHLQVKYNKDGGKCSFCGAYVSKNNIMATCTHRRCRNHLKLRFCLRKDCHKNYHLFGYHLY